jgi:hypothetical protein
VPPNDLFNNPILFETYPYQNYSLNIENATREGDPLPPNNPACPVSLPATAVGIHYEIPGDLDTDGVVMNVGGPVWYSNRRVIPREEGVADTAIVIYEENDQGGVGVIIACDDDNAPGEVSVSNVNFDLDPTKTYRAVVWNEGEATLGAIIEIAAASFDLVSPLDDIAALDAPTSFTWQPYANTFSYYFKIARTSDDPLSKYSLVELSPEADVDNLTCNTVLCTLTVVPGSILAEYLTDGNYLWSVGANMSATDTTLPLVNSNQIFRFIVGELPKVNLLTNGNFETDNDADKQPDGWTGSKLTSDKLKCNKPDKEVAYEGVCAYFFKGSADENAALTQNVDGSTLVIGQGLTLNVQVRGKGITSGTKIVVNVKYLNGGGTKEKIGFILGNIEAYSFFSTLPIELLSTVSSVKVTIKSKRLTGKLFVDDLQLTTVSSAVSRAGHEPLTLPPASGLTGLGQ